MPLFRGCFGQDAAQPGGAPERDLKTCLFKFNLPSYQNSGEIISQIKREVKMNIKKGLLKVVLWITFSCGLAFNASNLRLYAHEAFSPNYLFSTEQYKNLTLNRINYHRQMANLPPVVLNDKLSMAAQSHADYLVLNNVLSHYQDETKPGFTGKEAKDRAQNSGYDYATVGEVISVGLDAEDGVDSLIMAIYHRYVILNPSFKEVGIGDSFYSNQEIKQMVQVIVFGTQKGDDKPQNLVGIYPGDKAEQIPTAFSSDTEKPDPIENQDIVGYPISIHFSEDLNVADIEFSLHLSNEAIEVTQVKSLQQDSKSFSIIPLNPLSPNTVYTAHFKAMVNNQEFSKTWSFKTVTTDNIVAEPSSLTITTGAASVVTLKNYVASIGVEWTGDSITVAYIATNKYKIQALKPGKSVIKFQDKIGKMAEVIVEVVDTTSLNLAVTPGWNLLSSILKIDLTKHLVASDIISIWKWEDQKWSVKLPAQEDGGASYASQKGFNQLKEIQPGEGFWVNAKANYTESLTGEKNTNPTPIKNGWNLVGLKKEGEFSVQEILNEGYNQVVSAWKWQDGKWAVHLPGQADKGQAYASQKGFYLLEKIKCGEGFWINNAGNQFYIIY